MNPHLNNTGNAFTSINNDTLDSSTLSCMPHRKSAIEMLTVELLYLLLERLNPLSALRLACASRVLHRVIQHNDAFWCRRYEQLYRPESDFEADLPRLLNSTTPYNASWFNVTVRRELIEQRWRKGGRAAYTSITPLSSMLFTRPLLGTPTLCASSEYTAVYFQNRLFFNSIYSKEWREIHLPGYHHHCHHHHRHDNTASVSTSSLYDDAYTYYTDQIFDATTRACTSLSTFHLRGPFLLAYVWGHTRDCKLCVWDLRTITTTTTTTKNCSLVCRPLAQYTGYTSILAGNYLATENEAFTNKMLVRDLAATARRLPFGRPFTTHDPEVRQLAWPNGIASFGHCHHVDDRHEPVLLCVGDGEALKKTTNMTTATVVGERALWVSTADLTVSSRKNDKSDGKTIWWHSPVKVPLNGRPCWDVARFAAGHNGQLILHCHMSRLHDRYTSTDFVLVCCSTSEHELIWCRDEPEKVCELFSFRGANRLVAATVTHRVRLFNLTTGELLREIAPDLFFNGSQHHSITLHRVIGGLLAITSHGEVHTDNGVANKVTDTNDTTAKQLELLLMDVKDGEILWKRTLAQSVARKPDNDQTQHHRHYDHPTEAAICATRLCVYNSDANGILEMNFAHGLI